MNFKNSFQIRSKVAQLRDRSIMAGTGNGSDDEVRILMSLQHSFFFLSFAICHHESHIR